MRWSAALLGLLLSGCATMTDLLQTPLTRTERDVYTIVVRDTVERSTLQNPPGADHGVLFPSMRQTQVQHTSVLRDSMSERHYPNFIRVGLFESVGLLGVASAADAYDAGLFGLFPDVLNSETAPQGSRLFTGAWRRFGIVEYRFPWFLGARDWSIGSVGIELFQLSRYEREWLIGLLPLYVRKRWYVRHEPPYVAAAAGLGVSLLPSQYLNVTGSVEVGSLGGLNLRGYAGFLWGQTPAGQRGNSVGISYAKPYVGVGVSLLDFVNREEELQEEWSLHRHSAWSVGVAQFAFLHSPSSRSIWTDTTQALISGMVLRLLPVQLAIPVGPAGLYAGTALTSVVILGLNGGALGVLPIRMGYWRELVPAALYADIGAEALYYPSNAVHLSARCLLRLSDIINLFATVGFANGAALRGSQWTDVLESASHFSGWYIGIGMGIGERLFRQSDLWYYRH